MEFIDKFTSYDEKTLFYLLFFIVSLLATIIFRARDDLNKRAELLFKDTVTNEDTVKAYQDKLIPELKYKPSIYRTILYKTLGLLDQRLGEWRLFSLKALEAHFKFSLIYSFFFFYLVWLLGGISNIGTIKIFPNPDRLITSLYLIFEIVISYLSVRSFNNIGIFIQNSLFSIKNNNIKDIKDIIEIVLVVGVLVVVIIIVLVVGVLVVLGVLVSLSGIVAGGVGYIVLLVVGFIVGGFIGFLLVVVLGGGVVLGGFLESGANEESIILIIFFLILPFINTSFDYISMIVSRYYSQKMLKDTKIELLGHLLVDLVIAIVLLILLAYSLYAVVELTNIYIIKKEELFIPIEAYKHQLLIDPFARDVLWITLMFVSTLIPTLLHLILGLYSLLAMIIVKPHLHNLDKELKEINFENNLQKKSICEGLAQYELASSMKWYIFMSMFLILLSIFVMYIISIKMVGGS